MTKTLTKKYGHLKSYQYAQSVLSGKQIACRYIKLAAERFISDLNRKDLYFDIDEAERVTEFFENILNVPELKKPVPLPPPHAFWIQQLYGFKYKATKLRRFTTVYNQVARKNFKTFEVSGITNYEAILGDDPNAEIMHGANSRDQALICTDMTGKLIKSSPELRDLVEDESINIYTYKKKTTRIVYEFEDRYCTVEAMPNDPGDGGNPSVAVVDEYHEAKDSTLLETMESGQGQRLQPLILVITSPGHNKQGPCFKTLRKKSIDILEGKAKEDTHLAIVFELDDKKEWDDIDVKKLVKTGDLSLLDVLEKSNPMMPYSPTLRSYLARRIIKATNEPGTTAANIIIKNAGIWIDAPRVWIPSNTIKANNHGLTDEMLVGKPCFRGVDLSAGMDLNSVVDFFPNLYEKEIKLTRPDGSILKKTLPIHGVKASFWIPEQKVEDRKKDGVDYQQFIDEGFMRVFQGNAVNHHEIAQYIEETHAIYDVRAIGVDAKYSSTGPAPYLHEKGLLEPSGNYQGYCHVGQGFNLTGAVSQIEIWAANHQLDFMNNTVMEMCFQNTTLHVKGNESEEGGLSGDRFPSKGKSNGRIDGVTAFCNAVTEFIRIGVEAKKEPGIIGLQW